MSSEEYSCDECDFDEDYDEMCVENIEEEEDAYEEETMEYNEDMYNGYEEEEDL